MALSSALSQVLVCGIVLCFIPSSLSQLCKPSGGHYYNIPEGPGTDGQELFNTTNALSIDNNGNGYLNISQTSGANGVITYILYLDRALDYEERTSITGRIQCVTPQAGSVPYDVYVYVTAVNEFAPVFTGNLPYTTNVTEDTRINTTVFTVTARDIDSTTTPVVLTYDIVDNTSPFVLDENAVVLKQTVDFDAGPTVYALNISATEIVAQGKTNYTTLQIYVADIDDIGPVFTHNSTYTLSIPEGPYAANNGLFATNPPMSAQDGDSFNEPIILQLDHTSTSLADRFTVESNGTILTIGDLIPGMYTLNIRAYQKDRYADRFAIASVLVTVYDINDNSPVMSRPTYSASVLEGAVPGTVVRTVSASDLDQGTNSSFLFHLNDTSVPFNVSTDNGVGIIRVTGPINRETMPTYTLYVFAKEDKTPVRRQSNVSVVSIKVLDVNDNSPIFQGDPYAFSVNETDTQGHVVGQVRAIDADEGRNRDIVYSITNTGLVVSAFSVNSSTGAITLSRDLSQNDTGLVRLEIKAEDNGLAKRSGYTEVKVTILAVNEYPPVFDASSYTFTVPETVALGFSLGIVTASDRDGDALSYTLENDVLDEFRLDGNPPTLAVNRTLDLDPPSSVLLLRTFQIVVTDGKSQATADVTVNVTMVNEYPPVMTAAVYRASVMENGTSGTMITQISATDADAGQDGVVTYTMESPSSGVFALNSSTGQLTLYCTDCLDFNVQAQYTLVVKASDGGSVPRSDFATVIVTVEDVNDKAPRFTVSAFSEAVREDTDNGTIVFPLLATDDDTPTSQLTYSLGNVTPPWLGVEGQSVVTTATLDAESSRFITGMVNVSDGVQESSVPFTVMVTDVNDNYPQILLGTPDDTAEVPENATVGTHVLTITATDDDVSQSGDFLFYLGFTSAGKFDISSNGSQGEISVAARFDRRIQTEYDLTISVSDNSAPPKINTTVLRVIITDSNSAPEFVNSSTNASVSFYTFSVSESQDVGFVLGEVKALDPDQGSSGEVRYTLQSQGNDQGDFLLDPDSGELSLNHRLDFEERPSYSLTVNASDNSYAPKWDTATVTITVKNVVEAPQWPAFLPVVPLTTDQSCSDVRLDARPQDVLQTASSASEAEVVYSLLNNTQSFSINSSTGLLRRNGSLNIGNYYIGLRACSSLNTSVCSDAVLTVQVSSGDIVTFCPPFLAVTVNESAALDHVVVDLNSTKGDNDITYSLIEGATSPFRVNASTGVVSVNGTLDRETTPLYILSIVAVKQASSESATAQVTVTIEDAPDSAPRFQRQSYLGELSELAPVGTPVTSTDTRAPLFVTADDQDVLPTLTYIIVANEDNSGGKFLVNETTGEVTLGKAVDLETMAASLKGQYVFKVMVFDGYFNDTTSVSVTIIDENDNKPVFQPNVLNFTVNEAKPINYEVTTFNATDKDAGDTENLVYTILPDDGDVVPFAVSQSGMPVLRLTTALNRESKDFYSFTVVAKDKGDRNGTARVNIAVGDANEAPRFGNSTYDFVVSEGPAGKGRSITLAASDDDIGSNAVLVFAVENGDPAGLFNITSYSNSTAVLEVVGELDRESTPTLTLIVAATDMGTTPLTATATVEVSVEDVNDNDPQFSSGSYTADVSENVANNTHLNLVPALVVTDKDQDAYGRTGVVFSLEEQDSAFSPFRVDSPTGDIFVFFTNDTQQLDREIIPTYSLILVATDDNGAGRNSSATVTVLLSDVNDLPPNFLQQHYDLVVTENALIGTSVATFNATDSDSDRSLLRFVMYGGAGAENMFYLNPVSGELKVSGPLDRETRARYDLTLGVSDGTFSRNATATITVEDENDNCPVFHNAQPLELTFGENEDPGVIYTFNVTDSDAGSNSNITLSMSDTAGSLYVSVTSDGVLSTTQRLDREKDDQKSVTFTILATDAGSTPCVTSQRVEMEVIGDNEETPRVCQITREQYPVCGENISVSAFTGSSAGTFLAALTWLDGDDGEGGRATLSLTDDPYGLFSLNATASASSTILTLAATLDLQSLLAAGVLADDNATYSARVRAVDEGRQPRNSSVLLTLTVKELLPTTPVFSSTVFNFSVMENHAATVIGSVEATPHAQSGTQEMSYSLESAPGFTINNGSISTVSKLDREVRDFYTFLVLAWDSSATSDTASAVVLVTVLDENDNTPQLSPAVYDVTVVENIEDVVLVTLVASDDDAGENGLVTFSLLNDSLGMVFVLNGSTGELYLNQSLDRETESSYTLFVNTSDGGSPPRSSTATVSITVQDVNDNSPTFSENSYTGYLDELTSAATLVTNVTATDADAGLNGQVLYQLQATGSAASTFYINELSGAIYTSRSFSYASQKTFNLSVIARDVGIPSHTSSVGVTIYVNDLSSVLPDLIFDPKSVALVLGTPADTILPVNVSGGYGNYNFTIIGGNDGAMFDMDEDSGQISVSKELTQARLYELTIRVTNVDATEYSVEGTLPITVTSVRLEQERYAAVLPENTPPPFLLLDINSNAERSGIPVTYQLTGDSPTDAFYMSASTGQLFCNQSLDREVQAQYLLHVLVRLTNDPTADRRKRELSNAADVVVIVNDVNDNPPRFDVTSAIFGIPRSAPAYTVVTTLKASDPDAGDNGAVTYTASGGSTDTFFVTSDGKVTSLQTMPSQEDQQYTLQVTATDNNGAGQSTGMDLKIVVVPSSARFILLANITVTAFTDKQQFYLRNLSGILNMTLQLDKVEAHRGTGVDPSKSDIYIYAFDNNAKPIPFGVIDEKVKENSAAIQALFGASGVQVVAVTETPVRVRIVTKYKMGEAEIAVIVVACLIFVGSFIAIILTMRAWKKQKELQKREQAAARARQRLEQETRDLADKIQETSFMPDPDEPLELHRRPLPQPTGATTNNNNDVEEEEGKGDDDNYAKVNAVIKEEEEQECVFNFGNENAGLDTVALRRVVLRQTEAALLQALMEEAGDPMDLHHHHDNHQQGPLAATASEADSGTELHSNTEGSVSSGEHNNNPEAGMSSSSSGSPPRRHGSGVGGVYVAPYYVNGGVGGGAEELDAGESSTDDLVEVSPAGGDSFLLLPKPVAVKPFLHRRGDDEQPGVITQQESSQQTRPVSYENIRQPSSSPTKTSAAAVDVAPLVKQKGGAWSQQQGWPDDKRSLLSSPVTSDSAASPPPNRTTVTTGLAGSVQQLDTEDEEQWPPDDPEPDYQKRVSFSEVLDEEDPKPGKSGAKNMEIMDIEDEADTAAERSTDTIDGNGRGPKAGGRPKEPEPDFLESTSRLLAKAKAEMAQGFVNPAYRRDEQEEKEEKEREEEQKKREREERLKRVVVDGWAQDYEERFEDDSIMSTEL